ncbi:protein NO VEIN [Cannabis sativa]|uniref:protein NO VEIN n=1 Tax=Cannabis sativa TaxID=3483 RepID=UPI0029CA9AD9|nr:protein NO VEIN [Cannabis sativa]
MDGGHWRWPQPQQRPPYYSQQQPLNSNYLYQNPNSYFQSPVAFQPQNAPHHQWQQPPPPTFPAANYQFSAPAVQFHSAPQNRDNMIEKVGYAVEKARKDFIAAGKSVSSWQVAQAAISALKIDSWLSLGFRMQEVPSLNNIILVEGKINAFIHCFVAVRRITSVYELEQAICQLEGVAKFDELGLGPLVRHPLIVYYFSLDPDTTEVFKITSKELMSLLFQYQVKFTSKGIQADDFLNFIAEKKSVATKEELGIRVESLRLHTSYIVKAKRWENSALTKLRKHVKTDFPKENRQLLRSLQKKELDERFNAISDRVESFSSVHKDFRGKHTKFVSSSSEDEFSDGCVYEDDSGDATDISTRVKSSDRPSSCPYPSAAEEITRLGLKGETKEYMASANTVHKHCNSSGAVKKKRKFEELSCNNSEPAKLRKIKKVGLDVLVNNGKGPKESSDMDEDDSSATENDFSVTDDSLRMFIAIWKDRCRGVNVGQVLKRMLRFYKAKDRKKMMSLCSCYPFIGLLNVAVSSIKLGMWDSIYDTVQAISKYETLKPLINDNVEYESISVEPRNDVLVTSEQHARGVSVEDIIKKVTAYVKLDHETPRNNDSIIEKRYSILINLSKCERWVTDRFCVKEFRSLGYGDFLLFLEKYASLLPQELCKLITGDVSEKSPLEVRMMHQQLVFLLSQASNNLWENGNITKQDVSSLLMRQFPFVSFKVVANGSLEDFLSMEMKDKGCVISKSVIFSVTLSTRNVIESSAKNKNDLLKSNSTRNSDDQDVITCNSVTNKDAIEVLLKAPMLSDLTLWSHWDLLFAPSLGPLVPWLLNEVKTDELLCLVTGDGKVVRIDPSATVDSFLEAAIQGSSFQTAVKFLSLFSIVGGEKHVPFSLLKCHAKHAFKVIWNNSLENVESNSCGNFLFSEGRMASEAMPTNSDSKLQSNLTKMNVAVSALSRFVLDCLRYLPSEFRSYAADVFLFGMQPVTKDAASAILCECKQLEQRLMLHEVGLTLGIMEWINDYHSLSSNESTDLYRSGDSEVFNRKPGSVHKQDVISQFPTSDEGNKDECVTIGENEKSRKHTKVALKKKRKHTKVSAVAKDAEVSGSLQISELNEHEDAALVIESIRKDEFGLDSSLSNADNGMLKKQHARLGRALHCLSQELYSQDSHFLLELVQNADDNIYPENVEPTLTFILQDSGIIVLNNERGFSAQNIRALCDVGSSTKKGSNAGYIGQKGIGFKSVFRITDAPEIHSNGFHVKFDISEGQIGFVLPTSIPSRDLNLISRLASSGSDRLDIKCCSTCIVLPFRSKLSEGTVVKNIITMFSDLHPSLLLFLHRLQCIKFRNLLDDSLIVMRKEIMGHGIVNVSHGNEKMTWFVVSQILQADFIRSDVQMTEISVAFTLQESNDGGYSPLLSQQPVFAFLPLRTYGLKFILQGDFVLPSSREEVDGNSPWNQWLLSEFPGLFVKAEISFCNLPCFKDSPGKAISAFMSFVPLIGEVHGFFSSLPRMIVSRLRVSKCLLLEGGSEWVPPCKVLRGWNEEARSILPADLLHEHLGLGFLDKNIILSDPLARTLGVEEYGPKILVQFMSSLCRKESVLKSMGLSWLSSYLIELYTMSVHSGRTVLDAEVESDCIDNLRNISFIPLSNGTYSAVSDGTIWLHFDGSTSGTDGEYGIESFPNLYARLRIVNPALLTASSVDSSRTDLTVSDKLSMMLYKIGVQRLSAHEIIKLHILPAISDETIMDKDKNLMTEYVCFVMSHLNFGCPNCLVEREYIISQLQNSACILTNYGFKQPSKESIHFSEEFGNSVNVNKLIEDVNITWHEVDVSYLKHPITKTLPSGLIKWREFFQGIGVTDFVKVLQVEKSVADISPALFKHFMSEGELISQESIVNDWESHELVNLLSLLSTGSGNRTNCEYLLVVFDKLWDSCFSDKVTGYCTNKSGLDSKAFKSTFLSTITDAQWVVSTLDDKLHYPKDLYYDCEAVRSVLGTCAPYACPKVKSEKLVCDIGFKTKVTLEDVLEMLEGWRSNSPFMVSITQMSKLYNFIWHEVAVSKKLAKKFCSEPCIFVPYTSSSRHEDVVSGIFLSPGDVFWNDPTGAMEQMKEMLPQHSSSSSVASSPLNKTLCNIYPGLHEFFVNVCGVHEKPPLPSYVQILQQLSSVVLPHQASKTVFQVLVKWSEGLNSGLTTNEVADMKDSLSKVECTILPTLQDKWVSLHHSFGFVCWCDDKKLKNHFKNLDKIVFLHFGKLGKEDKEMMQTKVSVLMRALGIPALSEVVSREAICRGVADSSFKASLINWALPYAQRYLSALHTDKYSQLKQSGYDNLNKLQVVVVEQLFYRNVVKGCSSKSEKRVQCDCLLQGDILYATPESDAHALFMELTRLFFGGNPELHMANFLHMITTMAESGSSEDQTEFFILNSQKIPKLPEGESVWSLVSEPTLPECDKICDSEFASKLKRKAPISSKWPPLNWNNAPGFDYARGSGFKTQASMAQTSFDSQKIMMDDCQNIDQTCNEIPMLAENGSTNDDYLAATSTALNLQDPNGLEHYGNVNNQLGSQFSRRDQIRIGAPNAQGILTGRLGEQLAYNYFVEKVGKHAVRWVNEHNETGLPYDLIVGEEYIEVKATISPRKNWLKITMNEWKFAIDQGDSFSIAHVVILENNIPKVSVFKNPVKLLYQGKLHLVVVMAENQEL